MAGTHWRRIALLACVFVLAAADDAADAGDESLASGIRVAYRAYQQCETEQDAFSCLKLKALRSMDRAMTRERISLIDGLTLVPTPTDTGRAMGDSGETPLEEVDEAKLPSDPAERGERLDDLLSERVSRFLSGHSLQLDVPRYLVESRQLPLAELVEEGRKDSFIGGGGGGGGNKGTKVLKKNGGLILLALMMKGGLLALAFKAVALLAGKALMVAKIALVLAGVIGLSKLFSGQGHDKTTYEIVKHPHVSHAYSHSSSHELLGGGHSGSGGHFDASGGGGGGGGGHGWGRSMDAAAPYPHLMAYRGQLPAEAQPVPVGPGA